MTYSKGTNNYNFAFDYISKYYVKVRINNNDELTYGTHYTVADKTVALNSVVTLSEGDLIEIFRETPTDKTVEWYDSSILRAQDLNLFNVQLMHINEENMDKLLDSGMQEDKLDSKWDARLKPIKNLANPTKDDEAINYGFLKSTQNGYLQASQAKIDEATSKARDAMIQADRAYEQAEIAKQNATNAYNEANRAYSEAERSKGYADKATTSEDNVSTMKTSVEATKTEVDNIKKAVEDTGTALVNAVKNAQAEATADVDSHKASAVTALEDYKMTVASYRDATAMSATNAANSAANATNEASNASASAANAANSATNAANSATNAANSAAEAKTYKDKAKAIVGGDFLTTTDASKALGTHNTDQAAHPDKLVNLTTNGNSLRAVKGNGTNVDLVVPYAVGTTQANPKNLGNYTTNKISDIRDLFNNELADMNTKGCSVRFIKFGAHLTTIYNNWAKNWDATMGPWGTIYGVMSLLSDDTYANVELIGWTGTTVLLQRIAGNWKTAERKVYTNGMLNVADALKLQSNELTLDMGNGTQTNINIGLTPKNYSGSGFTYTFYNGKNSLADIYADEYYGTFRGKAMVGGITVTTDLNKNYADVYSKKLEVTDSGTANNLPYKWNFITTFKNNSDIAQLAIPISSNARISLRCLPNQSNNTLVGDWLEIPYLRDIQPIAAAEVAKVVNSAPSTLDTLNELAAALGNDPNFATTVSTQIGQKANKTDVDSQIQNVNTQLSQAITTLQNGVVSSVEGKKGEVNLWDVLHRYEENYVPTDTSNRGWNSLGVCIIYYTQNMIKNQPTQYGQLINIPANKDTESMQIWVSQYDGKLYTRGGNTTNIVNDSTFVPVGREDRVYLTNGAQIWVE